MIARRMFVIAFGLALATPLAALAQQQKLYRIGYLANDPDRCSPTYQAFIQKLRDLGWVEGTNLQIEYESPAADNNKQLKRGFPELAAEFVRTKVDLIVTTGTPPTRAAIATATRIPIVFGSAQDPVRQGFVKSLSHPGENVTGLAVQVEDLGPKRLEILKEMLPRAKRIARLYHEGATRKELHSAIVKKDDEYARKHGVTLDHVGVDKSLGPATPDETVKDAFDAVFASLKAAGTDAMYVKGDSLFVLKRALIAQLALKHRLPVMGPDSRFSDEGALLSYGENYPYRYAKAAELVHKIFKGAKPAGLPVEELSVELVVNYETAKKLGIDVPYAIRVQAKKPMLSIKPDPKCKT